MEVPDYPAIDAEEAKRLGQANGTPPRHSRPIYPPHYTFPREKLSTHINDSRKIPLVIVACGSFSPITYLHLRMFEMAVDYIKDQQKFELLGAYLSPVSDAYNKPGLTSGVQRQEMCQLAVQDNQYIMVDAYETLQEGYIRTAQVLDHFDKHLNDGVDGGCVMPDGTRQRIRINLLAGGDLIQSFAIPNLWNPVDLDHILGDFGCIIIERKGNDVYDFLLQNDHLHQHRKSVFVVKQSIHNDISSTTIRLFVRRGMSIKYLVPDAVMNYISEHHLYE